MGNPQEDTKVALGTATPPASHPKEQTKQCPPPLTKGTQEEQTTTSIGTLQAKDPKQSAISYTKVNRAITEIAKRVPNLHSG